jgi:hypothetical protein
LPGAGRLVGLRGALLFGFPGGSFARQQHHLVRFNRSFTIGELLGLMGTYSGLLVRPEQERSALLKDVRGLIESRARGRDAIEIPMVTRCWRAGRR